MKKILTVIIFLTTFLQGIAQSVDTVIIRNNIGDIKNFFINSSGGVGTDSIIVRHDNKRSTISPMDLPVSTAMQSALSGKQPIGSYLVAADIAGKLNKTDTSAMLSAYQTAINGKQATIGFTPYNATNPNGYISVVPAQSFASLTGKPTTLSGYGITDNVLLTNGSAALLTGFPILNQSTTGNAATVTTNANLTGPVTSVGNVTSIAAGAITSTMTGRSSVNNLQAISAGTTYTLTATSAKVLFGTTSPIITLSQAGTYLINYNIATDYLAATLAASRNIAYKVRRTNNTALDIDVMPVMATPVITLLTFSAPMMNNSFIYTATAGDILEVWGSISVIPTAGTVKTSYGSINATKLY